MEQGFIVGFLLFVVIYLTCTLIDNKLWYKHYKEFGRNSSERPTGFVSGLYMAYKNWKRNY